MKNSNVTKVDVNTIDTLPAYLGKGEQAVISYAIDVGIKDVLIDEGKARAIARFYKLRPKGTLGVLHDARIMGVVDKEELEDMVFNLVQKGYRIKEEILIEFLKKIRGWPKTIYIPAYYMMSAKFNRPFVHVVDKYLIFFRRRTDLNTVLKKLSANRC